MYSRLLTIKDYEQFSQVSSTAYIHDAAETTFEEDKEIFGTFTDDNILISQIECGFVSCHYGSSSLKCAAVGGVASRPEYRRSGGVRKTFNAVFENALKKDCAISILYPFSIAYYNKFGYESILKCFNAKCSFKAFERLERFSGVTLATEAHSEELSGIYERIGEKTNLMFKRENGKGFCLTPYNSMKYTYFLKDGESEGYVLLSPDRAARTIYIKEILFSDKNALTKLLGFLRTYDGNYDTVIFEKLPLNTPFFNFIDDENRLVSRTLFYNGAARILDFEAVLKANTYPNEKGRFSIRLTDNEIERNNGIFTVDYEKGQCRISKNETEEYDISLDMLSASRIILGREGLNKTDLEFMKNVEIKNDITDFLKAFPKRATMFYDDF